ITIEAGPSWMAAGEIDHARAIESTSSMRSTVVMVGHTFFAFNNMK
ncbi:6720_t:CDS:1, partial [Acaulospora colombiana]